MSAASATWGWFVADVFLSYDHDDADRAAPIAAMLEEAGHSVWWDRHIRGGAEYNSEIEGAVERADAVVVLWSERSVRSAWVRDEAAEGRDRGKLVPVLLDPVRPPMGFRQFQTIDVSGWKPRQRLPKTEQLLQAVGNIGGIGSKPERSADPKVAAAPMVAWTQSGSARWLAAGLAAIVILAGLVFWNSVTPANSATVAAVAPADQSALSRDYSRDLLAKLSQMQSASSPAVEFTGKAERGSADFTFEVAASNDAKNIHANLVLVGRGGSKILWSGEFDRPLDDGGDLRQQLGYTATVVLRCAVEAHDAGAIVKTSVLKDYLNGCAQLADPTEQKVPALISTLRRVVSVAPGFGAAWSKLLLVEAYRGKDRRLLKRDLEAAKKVNRDMPGAYIAEVLLLSDAQFSHQIALVDRAVATNPDDPDLLLLRAEVLLGVGRIGEAVADARAATELDPISPRIRGDYILALASAGQLDAAFKELAELDRIWPGSSGSEFLRYILNARYGDPRVAVELNADGRYTSNWARSRRILRSEARANIRKG